MTFKEWKFSVDWPTAIWALAFLIMVLWACFGKSDGKPGCEFHVEWGQPATQATK